MVDIYLLRCSLIVVVVVVVVIVVNQKSVAVVHPEVESVESTFMTPSSRPNGASYILQNIYSN